MVSEPQIIEDLNKANRRRINYLYLVGALLIVGLLMAGIFNPVSLPLVIGAVAALALAGGPTGK